MRSFALFIFWCLLATVASAQPAPPRLLYSNQLPGTKYPIKVTMPPLVWGHATVIASVDGDAMVLGGTIMANVGSWNLEAGNFSVGLNPTNSSGMHVYQVGPGIQTSGDASLVAGKPYTIASTFNGVHLSLYVCSPTCIKTFTVDRLPLALGTAAYIGASAPGIRVCSTCHIWNVKVMSPLTDDQVQVLANSAPDDPYPSPTPVPTAAPTSSANPTKFVTMSDLFRGKTPFHNTVAELKAAGGNDRSDSDTVVKNLWCCGLNNDLFDQFYYSMPINTGNSSQTFYTISGLNAYGSGNPLNGSRVHLATPPVQEGNGNSDSHTIVLDDGYSKGGAEVDIWGNGNQCKQNGSNLSCNGGWGGYYLFSGSGIATDQGTTNFTGNAGGYAFGLFQLTAQDLLSATNNGSGPAQSITHGLGIMLHCGQQGSVYPSTRGMDWQCGSSGGALPAPKYGELLYLKSSYVIPNKASVYCQSVLLTLKTRGAWFYDVSPYQNNGAHLAVESPQNETVTNPNDANPWFTIIEPALHAAGEGSGTPGTGYSWDRCMNYTNDPSYWSVMQINQAGKSAIP